MNRILLLLLTSLICFFITSCDDDETHVREAVSVTGLTYVSGPGNILLRWIKPETKGISYVEIVYKSDDGIEKKVMVNGQENEKLIYGFGNQNQYTFIVTVYMEDGSKSTSQTIDAIPGEPAFVDLLQTVEISGNFGGVDLKWDNPSDDKFYLHVSYQNDKDEVETTEVDVTEKGKGKQFVGIVGVLSANLSISVTDVVGNTSDLISYNYKNLERGKFDRSIWAVVDFSSQEEKGETLPNGPAAALLDGDKASFWHSQWKDKTPEMEHFPHYVTFDLKRRVKITRGEITHRPGKMQAKGIILYGSNDTQLGPWIEIIKFNMSTTAGSTTTFKLPEPVEFRYIKMFCETAGSNDAIHAALGDFALYGEDIVEDN